MILALIAKPSRILCRFNRHLRSKGRARRTETGWRSYCKRCGVLLVKEDGGAWHVPAEGEAAIPAPPEPDAA